MVTIQLDAEQAARLLAVLRRGDDDRLREIHRTEASDYRAALEHDAALVQSVEDTLERALARLVDERGEESFPASDPPAR